MPANKSFLKRIQIINSCLSGRQKYWSIQSLLDRMATKEISVAKRTIEADISAMKNSPELRYYAPIKYSKIKEGYYYEDPNYVIDNLPLTETDIQALEFATTTLSQYKNVKILNEFAGTVDKLINLVNHIKHTQHETSLSFIDFEKAPFVKGTEYLDPLIDAIKNKSFIEIGYQKFEDTEVKKHSITPCLLKEYRNRWYLLGHNTKFDSITTFALDRLTSIKILNNQPNKPPNSFKAETYFKNTIGITYKDGKYIEAILSFKPHQGKYIKTQYLHDTQEILIDNKKELRIRLKVVQNYELISTILSYGEDVKVIKPASLRNEVKNKIGFCYNLYHKG